CAAEENHRFVLFIPPRLVILTSERMENSSPTGTRLQLSQNHSAAACGGRGPAHTRAPASHTPFRRAVPGGPEDRHPVVQGERMNRFVGLAIGATLLVASQAYSCCLFCCCKGQGSAAPAPVAVAPAPVAVAPAPQFVEQQVTTYKPVQKTRKVEVTVY